MAISVRSSDCYIHNLKARMPFHYGIASLTAIPHIFVRLQCEIDGELQYGVSADGLIPKWFTKDPESSYQDDIEDMLDVIQTACEFAQQVSLVTTVFDLWQAVYVKQQEWAASRDHPPLLLSFGLSLVERAMIDAYCRGTNTLFSDALQGNRLGIRLDEIHAELAGFQPADLLPAQPLEQIIVRHTIGLSDPLNDGEISQERRANDGLPQCLEANLNAYGLTHLKIKLSGNIGSDIDRLTRVAVLLGTSGIEDFAFTLDGNEQFESVRSFQSFWQNLNSVSSLKPFMNHLLYVEQPLHRDAALCPTTQEPLRRWIDRPIMIIDESDSQLDSLKIALDCGYNGTSHKNCKGIFKGIANACLLEFLKRADPTAFYILSGEDLVNVGPVALPQDLSLMANLGIAHVERNGHHYFSGLSMFSIEIQGQVLEAHPDLYQQRPQGYISLAINNGKIHTKSCLSAPFGTKIDPGIIDEFTPASNWNFESLNL